eukprot:Nitzschia sp. Nitz4//scaffold221_size33835//24538//25770//NITZ4_007854-RA/size33835-processed-gene-0.16-mRNA-1//1//CDS//3329542566//9339//frame0
MSVSGPPDRSNKRHKGDPMGGPPPPDGYGYPPGRYQQPPYGPGGPPMGPRSGYMGWQHGQYGNPPPPSWGHGSPPPPGSMYPQQGGPPMTPDRGGYGSGYPRGPPPQMQGPPPGRRGGNSGPRQPPQPSDGPDGPHGPGYQGGGWGPGGQWSQSQWGNGPPPGWQGSGPPPPIHHGYGGGPPPNMYGNSPQRTVQRPPRGSPEMMGGYPGGPSQPPMSICQSTGTSDPDLYHSSGMGPGDDESNSVAGGSSTKDKGRGSYKCGRCGVPKKGHVCPYQPKLTRRPGEPLPEMRCAAIQVEMDEFMTLRRLNLKIQGFPESYASEPFMDDDMVVGEPHPHSATTAPPTQPLMGVPSSTLGGPPQDSVPLLGSPIRSSPIADEPIPGTA